MDLNKKEIIYELARGCHSKTTPQTYGAIRRKLIDRQGISEIALYSAVAEHLEENDIHPTKYIDEMCALLAEVSDNLFAIKTNDNYSFLRSSFSAINLEGSPESKGQFLCNKCFSVKNSSDRCEKPNYKNSCTPCYKEESKKSAKRYNERKKLKKAEDKLNGVNEPEPEPETEPTNTTQPEQETQFRPQPALNAFIEIESITGDSSETIVSISSKTLHLSKLLLLLDPYILVPIEKQSTLEKEVKNEAEIDDVQED